VDRRTLLRSTVVGMGAVALDPLFFTRVAGASPVRTAGCTPDGPYGPLQAEDGNRIKLPAGFSSRVVARSLSFVSGSLYLWPMFPDGGATFPLADGGWIYAVNSEVPLGLGGASSITFAADGRIRGARRILGGTNSNCAGGPTPWGTWLSCEEVDRGYVYECDVTRNAPIRRPALGRFKHEAAAVDGPRRTVYLTEDESDGCFYRFRHATEGDLSAGTLEVAQVSGPDGGAVTWLPVPDPSGASTRTRNQVAGATRFRGGEGAWYGDDVVHFTTKGDNRVWRYDVVGETLAVVYDDDTSCNPVLTGVDNVTVSRAGDVFVAEDGGNMQIVLLGTDGSVSPVVEVNGQNDSEITGPAFSPDGSRLYFSSQRGNGVGITYEVRGPFR
jgi:secreted PhoX family phosphatase